jgi:YegS/Rv2252/BmrU family lipid kinase
LASQLDSEVDALLIVGGDGTVNEVFSGLAGKSVPCVILPTGLENLLARALNMPSDAGRVAETLLHGQPFHLDVGEINGRRFLAVAGIGFDAECVLRMEQIRSGHVGHLSYFWPIWRTFWTHRFPALRVEVDGACLFEDRGLVLIGNVRRYSVGFHVHVNARYDDGFLDVCAFPCSTRRAFVKHAWRVFRRWHIGRGGVVYRQCRRIRITSPDTVPIEADGEFAGTLPAECTILPRAAQFLGSPSIRHAPDE